MTRKNLRGAVVGTVTLTWLALLTAGQSPPTGPALKPTPLRLVAQRLNKKSGSLRRRSPGVLLPGTVRLLSDDRSVERTGGVARDLVKQAPRDQAAAGPSEPARSTGNSHNFHNGNDMGRTRQS